MALMTARPWKHPKTGAYHIRQRTPLDLVARVKGQTVSLPIGDTHVAVKVGNVVQVSLRTKDAAEARTRHAVADGALKRFWEAQKAGPVSLTQRQVVALSGLVYADLTGALSEEPGSPDTFAALLRLHAQAREAGKLEQWVGGSVDQLLIQEGLHADGVSRARLVEAVDAAFVQAASHLMRNATGDFRPDPDASRFPEWLRPTPPSPLKPTAHAEVARVTVSD